MFDDKSPPVNPYAAPQEVAESVERALSRDDAIQKLARPARFQFWISALSVPIGIIQIAYMLSSLPMRPSGPIEGGLFAVLVLALFVVKPAASLLATSKVLKGQISPWAWIATIAGLIPFGTGCALIEMIFAFWLLHLLLKPEIRAALAVPTNRQP